MSLYPGFNKEKETSFSTLCMAKFGDFFVSLTKEIFSFLYRMVLFLSFFSFFFFFFTKGFFQLLIFPLAKIFPQAKSFYE